MSMPLAHALTDVLSKRRIARVPETSVKQPGDCAYMDE